MVVAVGLCHGAGESLVQDLPAGRNAETERQGLVGACGRHIGNRNHSLEACSLGYGSGAYRLAFIGEELNIHLEPVCAALCACFTGSFKDGTVQGALGGINQSGIGLHRYGNHTGGAHNFFGPKFCADSATGSFVVQGSVGRGGKGRFLRRELP